MEHKVGQRVKIKSLDWYNKNKDIHGNIECGDALMNIEKSQFCGKIVTISSISDVADAYRIEEDNGLWNWTDEMIEGLVEEEKSLDEAGLETDFEYEGLAYTLPKGYIFKDENGNVINATKIILEKKKEYPKTYEECEKILGLEDSMIEGCLGYEYKLLNAFQKLLMCRDAYWKIAGDEMGLGKPWEPDWTTSEPKYVISCTSNGIEKQWETTYCKVLVFPTAEMRDAFYENFKELIESVKELL